MRKQNISKKAEIVMKELLGLILISFGYSISIKYNTGNFFVSLLAIIPMWLFIFIFFKYRDWVEK
jgi:hypothetical protein